MGNKSSSNKSPYRRSDSITNLEPRLTEEQQKNQLLQAQQAQQRLQQAQQQQTEQQRAQLEEQQRQRQEQQQAEQQRQQQEQLEEYRQQQGERERREQQRQLEEQQEFIKNTQAFNGKFHNGLAMVEFEGGIIKPEVLHIIFKYNTDSIEIYDFFDMFVKQFRYKPELAQRTRIILLSSCLWSAIDQAGFDVSKRWIGTNFSEKAKDLAKDLANIENFCHFAVFVLMNYIPDPLGMSSVDPTTSYKYKLLAKLDEYGEKNKNKNNYNDEDYFEPFKKKISISGGDLQFSGSILLIILIILIILLVLVLLTDVINYYMITNDDRYY